MTCCTGNCNQGRDCPKAPFPTRRALGLNQRNGGEQVRNGYGFPIGDDAPDEPLITPAGAGWLAVAGQAALALFAIFCVVLIVMHTAHP